MRTYYEITNGNKYEDLTPKEREELHNRQDFLAYQCLEGNDPDEIYFNELFESLQKSIKKKSYILEEESSYGVTASEYESLMYHVLAEMTQVGRDLAQGIYFGQRLSEFEYGRSVPFRVLFFLNTKYIVQMNYRKDSYDAHRTTYRIGNSLTETNEEKENHKADRTEVDVIDESNFKLNYFELARRMFPNDEVRQHILLSYYNGVKNKDIVKYVEATTGKSSEAAFKFVTRTWKAFKEKYKEEN